MGVKGLSNRPTSCGESVLPVIPNTFLHQSTIEFLSCSGLLPVDQADDAASFSGLDRKSAKHAGLLSCGIVGIVRRGHYAPLGRPNRLTISVLISPMKNNRSGRSFDQTFWCVIPDQVLVCMCCTFVPTRKYLRYLRFHLRRWVACDQVGSVHAFLPCGHFDFDSASLHKMTNSKYFW